MNSYFSRPSGELVRARNHSAACMLRARFILLPIASMALAFPCAIHAADQVADASPALDEIIVTANPLGRTADELVQPVTVLSGEELDKKLRSTIGETLEHEPGVSTTDFGPGAGRPVIRGQAGPRIEILENGMSSMDVSDVSPDHAVTVDPAHAEQVEVIKGPATLLYGSGASGGVVNIIDGRLPTERLDGAQGSFGSYMGSNAVDRYLSGQGSYGVGNHVLYADGTYHRTGDYDIPGFANSDGTGPEGTLPNSATKTTSNAFSYGYVGSSNSFAASVSRFDARYGLPVEETAFIDMDQTRFDMQDVLNRPAPLLESLKLRAGTNNYQHIEYEAPGEPGTVFENRVSQARIEAVHVPLLGFRGVFGVQYNHRNFSAAGEEAYVPDTVTQQLGGFLVEERPYSLGKLELGVRVENDTNSPVGNSDRDFTPLSLSAGSIFNLGETHHLKMSVTRAERSPVPEELYAFGPHGATATFERGHLDAQKEAINNFEIGLDHHGDRLVWDANVYYQRAHDYLYLQEVDQGLNADGSGTPSSDGIADRVDEEAQFDPEGDLLLADYTQSNVKFYGFEAQAAYVLLTGPFKLTGRVLADKVRGKLEDGGNLPRITPMRYGIGFDAEHGPIAASVDFTRVEAQNDIAPLETPTSGYNMLSADLSYKFNVETLRDAQVFVRGRNLLDEEARRATSFIKDEVPLPGASVIVGFKLDI